MLSICINVKNGERYLARTLLSVREFEDVVLLDNYSKDNTVAIANKFSNVRVYQCEFTGMGNVRNLAASYAKHDWVLFVDCDEVLDSELVKILQDYDFKQKHIYNIYRKNFYNGACVESSSWGNDWIKRLYNRNDTKFANNQVHDNFIDDLPNVKIDGGFMYHFPYEMVSQLIDKMQFYSTLYAKQHFNKKKPLLWMIPFRAFFMFLKCYLLKRGFMDGYEGLVISSYNAMGVFSKYIKLYELYNKKNIAIVVKTSSLAEINLLKYNINKQTLLPEFIYMDLGDDYVDSKLDVNFVVESKIINSQEIKVDEFFEAELKQNPNIDYIHHCDFRLFNDKDYLKKLKKKLN